MTSTALGPAFSDDVVGSWLGDLVDLLSGGSIEVYADEEMPFGPMEGDPQLLLLTYTLNDPAATVDGRQLVFNTITGATAVASGEARWARAFSQNGQAVMDMRVNYRVGDTYRGLLLPTTDIVENESYPIQHVVYYGGGV